MVRGIRRLIDDIRNPKASKKRRKKKIDDLPDLPFFPKFKARPITKAAKELAKIFVEVGPEGGKTRLFDEPTPIITRHTQEQLDYEANLGREPMTMKDDIIAIIDNASSDIEAEHRQFSRLNLMPAPKKKRKVSAYSKEFGKQLKRLKKLHPRTRVQNLMKKAHRRTRAAMKKK